jgi:Antistasin family
VRIFAALLALTLAGCFGTFASEGAAGDDLDPAGMCVVDQDCILAGPSCCDCPTYATSIDSGWLDTCASVDCARPGGTTPGGLPPAECPALIARCDQGACVAECAPTVCPETCDAGFATDQSGCLTCACAPTNTPASCLVDLDCVEVPADCCGCERGGSDVAVPVADADRFISGLGCPADQSAVPCPDVSTCDPTLVPTCVQGQCMLATPGSTQPVPPPGACGSANLPPCPTGQLCVVNSDPGANPLGLGICVTPAP